MKIIALLLAIFAIAQAKPTFTNSNKALLVRGGGSIGPLDKAMGDQIGKAIVAGYVGGSASKFIAAQTGGSAPALANFLTNDLMSLLALVDATSKAAYFIGDTGFDGYVLGIALLVTDIILKANAAGGLDKIVDVLMANKVEALMLLTSVYVHYF